MWGRETIRQTILMANTRIERTIGVGILVEERRGLPPLAAHPPC